ncbi:MAG: Ig-like domain-containing protein, partial [Candidatus Eiseniibacteriota bacterium]
MKALIKHLALGLILLVPFSAASAQEPLLSPVANVALNAGATQSINIVAVDPNGGPVSITAALPPFATLNAPTVGTGVVVTSLTLSPLTVHVGDYSAAVTAMANGVSTIRVFQITVNAEGSDKAPVVGAPALQEVTEGSTLTFTVTASDPDGNAIGSLIAWGAPSTAMFTANGSKTSGTFDWTPGLGDAGDYDVQFIASNALMGVASTHIRVANAPSLAITPIDDVTLAGGSTASVNVHAGGVPGALISLTASLPSFATLNPPGSGTGAVSTTISITPPTGSAGTYHASVTAVSNNVFVTENFDIIVTGANGGENHAPQVTAPPTATVAVGSLLQFDVNASDPDGDHVDLFGSALPPGANFSDHGDMSGTFSWTPTMAATGANMASFTGTDGRGGSGTASTVITVTGATPQNHPPTLSAPLTQQVDEGANLSFTVTASDQDGDHVTLTADQVPMGATFVDQMNNSASFSWSPNQTQAGTHTVAFAGNDGHGGTATASTMITVMDVPPDSSGGGETDVPGKACLVG